MVSLLGTTQLTCLHIFLVRQALRAVDLHGATWGIGFKALTVSLRSLTQACSW